MTDYILKLIEICKAKGHPLSRGILEMTIIKERERAKGLLTQEAACHLVAQNLGVLDEIIILCGEKETSI